jgi:hypothetical protein
LHIATHDTIVEASGLKLVLTALEYHMADARLVEAACEALGHLSHNQDLWSVVVSDGGISCVLRALQHHIGNEAAVLAATFALGHMAAGVNNGVALAHADGIPIIVQALQNHISHPQIPCICMTSQATWQVVVQYQVELVLARTGSNALRLLMQHDRGLKLARLRV